MFNGKLEPGDRAVFTNPAPEYAGYTGKTCTVRTADSHTTVVLFADGYRMCVYPGELEPVKTFKAVLVVPKTREQIAAALAGVTVPSARSTGFSAVLAMPYGLAGRYHATEDEGSLA